MSGLPCVLVSIVIVVTIVTVVGHGIWVLLAALFGGSARRVTQTCVFCGRTTPASDAHCQWCAKDITTLLARELNDLEGCRRQIQRLRRKRTLDPEMLEQVLCQVDDYRQELLHPNRKPGSVPVAALIMGDEVAQRLERPEAAPPTVERGPETPLPVVPVAPVAPATGDDLANRPPELYEAVKIPAKPSGAGDIEAGGIYEVAGSSAPVASAGPGASEVERMATPSRGGEPDQPATPFLPATRRR